MLFDTSIVIKMIKEDKFELGSISVITLIEILRGIDKERREKIKGLLEEVFDVLGIDNKVITEYCTMYDSLKKNSKLIPDADLLIAATAKANNMILKTKDFDFNRLRDLGLNVTIETD